MKYILVERGYEVAVTDQYGVEMVTEMDQFELRTFDSLEEAEKELAKEEYEPEIETLSFGKEYKIRQYVIVWGDVDEGWKEEEKENSFQLVKELEELSEAQLDAKIDADDVEYAIGKKALKEELSIAVKYDNTENYKANQGWQDWMNEFTEANDGEEPDEAEMNEIEEIQNKIFNLSRWENLVKIINNKC